MKTSLNSWLIYTLELDGWMDREVENWFAKSFSLCAEAGKPKLPSLSYSFASDARRKAAPTYCCYRILDESGAWFETHLSEILIVMPLIEELPNSSVSRTTHGWAYVPDTGRDPAKINIPTGTRKRGAVRDAASSRDNISAKQQKAVQARLAELEKENFKDTTIPIPPKHKDTRGKYS